MLKSQILKLKLCKTLFVHLLYHNIYILSVLTVPFNCLLSPDWSVWDQSEALAIRDNGSLTGSKNNNNNINIYIALSSHNWFSGALHMEYY